MQQWYTGYFYLNIFCFTSPKSLLTLGTCNLSRNWRSLHLSQHLQWFVSKVWDSVHVHIYIMLLYCLIKLHQSAIFIGKHHNIYIYILWCKIRLNSFMCYYFVFICTSFVPWLNLFGYYGHFLWVTLNLIIIMSFSEAGLILFLLGICHWWGWLVHACSVGNPLSASSLNCCLHLTNPTMWEHFQVTLQYFLCTCL